MKRLYLVVPYLLVELYLYSVYTNHESSFHWYTHFFIGGVAALTVMTIYVYRTGRGVQLPLLWLLLAHVYAMVPDLIFNFEHTIHKPWMELFLFHISGHFVPGRNYTWYAIFMVSLGLYLFILHKKTVAKQ